jgi:hypothetical protein
MGTRARAGKRGSSAPPRRTICAGAIEDRRHETAVSVTLSRRAVRRTGAVGLAGFTGGF